MSMSRQKRRPLAHRLALFGGTAYVAVVSLRARDGRGLLLVGCVALALLAAYAAVQTLAESRRRALALYGLSWTLAAADAGGHRVVFAIAGAALAVTTGVAAVLEIEGKGGLAAPVRPARRLDRVAAGLWGFAFVPAVASALGVHLPYPVSLVTACGFALGGSFLLLGVAALDRVRRSPHELGANVRATTALVFVGVCAALGLFVSTASASEAFSPLEVGLALAAVLAAHVSEHADPGRTVEVARRAAVLLLFAGPVVFICAQVAEGSILDARLALIVAALVTALVAASHRVLSEPFLPGKGRFLAAFEKAEEALTRLSGDEAIAAVLSLLRDPAGPDARSPALYLLHPARVMTVDSAGYVRERPGEAPSALFELASSEPEATLRFVSLEPLYVRRADLRPIARWMTDAGVDVATVVTHEGEAEGLLVLGLGRRTDPFTLEEIVHLKRLTDKLASLCAMRAEAARGLLREQALMQRLEATDDRVAQLEHSVLVLSAGNGAQTSRLAEPSTLGFYSPASRLAFEAIERRVAQGAPLVVVAASGVDPTPYVARAHLGGPRGAGPFVVVDGTRPRDHDVARWSDPRTSPFAIAHGGFLFLLDGAALPPDVQALIGRCLAERRPPFAQAEPLDVTVGLSTTHGAELLPELLEPSLISRLADGIAGAVTLPRLRDRPEDLRAIVTDRLAREGLRVRGAPVGIDDRAFALLLAHPFPGEDAELRSLATRLVAALAGDVVRAADVMALELSDEPETPEQGEGGGHIFLVK
jgi:hypothetical protein